MPSPWAQRMVRDQSTSRAVDPSPEQSPSEGQEGAATVSSEEYPRVSEDPTEYALWQAFTKGMDEVRADQVPDMVDRGAQVWSFGYGWDQGDLDAGEYTTIEPADLWAWDEDDSEGDEDTVASWGPFAVDNIDHAMGLHDDKSDPDCSVCKTLFD